MIITAFPRAAGTIHGLRLAEQEGLRFADGSLQNDPSKWPEEVRKGAVHEAYRDRKEVLVPADEARGNPNKFVILSHNRAHPTESARVLNSIFRSEPKIS